MIILQSERQVREECTPSATVDTPDLVKCVDKLAEVAQRSHDQGAFARMVQFLRDGEDIRRLRNRDEVCGTWVWREHRGATR